MEEKKFGWNNNEQYAMVEYKGLEAIDKMLSNLMHDHIGYGSEGYKLKEFQNIIELFKRFLVTLNEIELNYLDKKYFLESIEYMYSSKIKVSIDELIKPYEKCGKVHHGDPRKLAELNTEIETSINRIKISFIQLKIKNIG